MLKSGEEISAKVLKIGENEIEYKKCDNQTGPTYTIRPAKVFMVRYANGKKDIISVIKTDTKDKVKTENTSEIESVSKKENGLPQNITKINLLGLVWGQIDLQYERALDARSSIHATIGIMPGSNQAPEIQRRINEATPNPDFILSSAVLSGFQFCPEYRIYTSGRVFQGFYVAPQLCYSTYTLQVRTAYGSSFSASDIAAINYGSFGVGAQIGMQWRMKNNISIDWQIIGAGVSFVGLNAVGTSAYYGNTGYYADKANYYIQTDARLNLVKFVTLKGSGNTITGVGNTILPYVRMGLAVGYAF